jgi:hypothetical protein
LFTGPSETSQYSEPFLVILFWIHYILIINFFVSNKLTSLNVNYEADSSRVETEVKYFSLDKSILEKLEKFSSCTITSYYLQHFKLPFFVHLYNKKVENKLGFVPNLGRVRSIANNGAITHLLDFKSKRFGEGLQLSRLESRSIVLTEEEVELILDVGIEGAVTKKRFQIATNLNGFSLTVDKMEKINFLKNTVEENLFFIEVELIDADSNFDKCYHEDYNWLFENAVTVSGDKDLTHILSLRRLAREGLKESDLYKLNKIIFNRK